MSTISTAYRFRVFGGAWNYLSNSYLSCDANSSNNNSNTTNNSNNNNNDSSFTHNTTNNNNNKSLSSLSLNSCNSNNDNDNTRTTTTTTREEIDRAEDDIFSQPISYLLQLFIKRFTLPAEFVSLALVFLCVVKALWRLYLRMRVEGEVLYYSSSFFLSNYYYYYRRHILDDDSTAAVSMIMHQEEQPFFWILLLCLVLFTSIEMLRADSVANSLGEVHHASRIIVRTTQVEISSEEEEEDTVLMSVVTTTNDSFITFYLGYIVSVSSLLIINIEGFG